MPLFETLPHLQEAGTTMRALLGVEEFRIPLQERGGACLLQMRQRLKQRHNL